MRTGFRDGGTDHLHPEGSDDLRKDGGSDGDAVDGGDDEGGCRFTGVSTITSEGGWRPQGQMADICRKYCQLCVCEVFFSYALYMFFNSTDTKIISEFLLDRVKASENCV